MKRKAPKAKVTSRGRQQNASSHRQTGYVRALLDPMTGPLVGVPQFVPIDTHRERVRAIGTIQTGTSNSARIAFNPCRMVAGDVNSIWYNTTSLTGTMGTNNLVGFRSNARQQKADFLATQGDTWSATLAQTTTIDNGDGVKARVVGAMIRVCNVSSVQSRGGVFTALHEPHHKTLEGFDLAALSSNSKSIIRPAGDGGYISLLYRPVKPEEVEDWQISPLAVPGQAAFNSGEANLDGTASDAFPGYMAIDFQGEPNTTLHVEAYAIVEYAGESLTTLVRPPGVGGGKVASPDDARKGAKDAGSKEDQQGTSGCEVKTRGRVTAQCDAGLGPAQQHADQLANLHEKDPPQVIRETRYSIVIENPDGTHDVYFKGTATPGSEGSAREWSEDGVAFLGFHLPAWDRELQYLADTYGYESDKVHYTGFSRGGGFAQYMGGTGYGSGTFSAYPPREGSQNMPSNADWHDTHSALNSWIHDHLITPVSGSNMHSNALGPSWVQEEATEIYDKFWN